MKHSMTHLVFLLLGGALLLLSALPSTVPHAAALPLAALTGTAEPPTPTVASPTPNRPTLTPSSTPSATATATVTPSHTPVSEPEVADPLVTKEVSPNEARIGDSVDFTITVTNRGNGVASTVVVTDVLPDFFDIINVVADRGTISTSGHTVVVTIGDVAPNDVVVIRIHTRVNNLAQPPGGRNSVILTTSSLTDNIVNNAAGVNLTILTDGSPTTTPASVPQASATPASSPPVPVRLPPTGAASDDSARTGLVVLGLIAIGLSWLTHALRTRSDRTNR